MRSFPPIERDVKDEAFDFFRESTFAVNHACEMTGEPLNQVTGVRYDDSLQLWIVSFGSRGRAKMYKMDRVNVLAHLTPHAFYRLRD